MQVKSSALIKCVFICIFLAGCGVFSAAQMQQTKTSGLTIVTALEKFKEDHGRYPDELADLAPRYLPAIPQPTWGVRRWIYKIRNDEFDLRVNESEQTGDGISQWLKWSVHNKRWETGD